MKIDAMESAPVSFLLLITFFSPAWCIFKMCAFPSLDGPKCELLELGNSNVSCVRVTDSVDCAIKLKEGKADFAVFTAEEAVLASQVQSVDSTLNVLGEIRYKGRSQERHFLEMVVVVKNSIPGVFTDLQKRKYCHPGLGTSHILTDRFLKLFERKIVPRTCSYNVPMVQQEVSDVAYFFGPSCRPGIWAADEDLDSQLKRMYPSLCKLCDSQQTCSYNTQISGSNSATLDCLTLKDGDVAFVPLETVRRYFGPGAAGQASPKDYSYLCPDQTKIPLNSTKAPCVWESQPWDLLISRSQIANDLKTRLISWTSYTKVPTGSDAWQSTLKMILLQDNKALIPVPTPASPSKLINRGVVDNDQPTCSNNTVKWCTTSKIENEKCEWLKIAAKTHGLRPYFNCVQRDGVWSCLNSIANGSADVISIKSDIGFVARKSYNLSTVVYEDNLLQGNYKVIAVVKNGSNGITSFSDLKNKKACFPEYNGLSYISFVNLAQQNNLLKKTCPAKYFSLMCTPGVEMFNTMQRQIDLSSHCTICPLSPGKNACSANFTSYERTVRAMKCLDNSGDVAFINTKNLFKGNNFNTTLSANQYSVLCKNGSIAVGTLSVDDNCALAIGVPAEIVARRNRSEVDDIDLKEMLLQLDRWFGTVGLVREGALRIFDLFKGQKGLLFKDTTISLVNADESNYNLINSYKSLIQNVTQVCSSASVFSMSLFIILGTVILHLSP